MSELRQAIAHHATRTPVDRVARVLDAFAIGLAGSRAGHARAGGGAGARFQLEEVEQRARQYLYGQRSSGIEAVVALLAREFVRRGNEVLLRWARKTRPRADGLGKGTTARVARRLRRGFDRRGDVKRRLGFAS